MLATLDDAPLAWRRAVIRAVRQVRRQDLADRLMLTARATDQTNQTDQTKTDHAAALLPDTLLVKLLPSCSEPVATQLLPDFAHLDVDWTRLGTAHPRPVLAFISSQLDELPDGLRPAWWRLCADGVAAAARAEPGLVLELLERHSVWRRLPFPAGLVKQLRSLSTFDAVRTLRLLVDAAGTSGPAGVDNPLTAVAPPVPYWARRGARMSRSVRRALLLCAPEQAVRWGRLCAQDDRQLAVLVGTLPPSRRDAFFDAVTAGRDLDRAVLAEPLLDALPHPRRHAEARRMLALPALEADPVLKLRVSARLPWAEGRQVLLEQTRAADAAARAAAYPLLVACVAAERDAAVFARFLDEDLGRIHNEQDPVRQPTLKALAQTPPALFGDGAVAALTRLGTDAVEARDVSVGSLSAVRQLARRLLVHHAESGDAELLAWGLRVLELELVEGATDAVDRERLDTVRHGQERAVVDVLGPWVRRGLERAWYSRLLTLAEALGRRAWAMPDVQGWLEWTIWNSPSGVAHTAIPLWLADPARRSERVEALVRWDPSVAKLWPVAHVIAGHRTDLLDPYLTGRPPGGRFVTDGVRWIPDFPSAAVQHWLPRQRAQYVKLLARIAGDAGSTASARADAIRQSATVGEAGQAVVDRYLGSANVVLQEAALGATVWLPDPAAAIPVLLEHVDDDRARVAVYALTRAAQFARPAELGARLEAVVVGASAKVTSRKEVLRIAAQVGVPDLVGLLLRTWGGQRQHRHVRMAAVSRLVGELDDARVWEVLGAAAGVGAGTAPADAAAAVASIAPATSVATAATVAPVTSERDVALALLGRGPLRLAVRHRAAYGALIAELCAHPDALVRRTAIEQVAAWYPWTPQAAEAIRAAVVDVTSFAPLPIAVVGQLVAAGWPVEEHVQLVRQLLEMAAAERDENVATGAVFRDRPARRRLADLAANLTPTLRAGVEQWRPVVSATGETLAAEPNWLHTAARLHAQALDLTAEAETFTTDVHALAQLTDDRPAAARAAQTLSSRVEGQGDPFVPDSFYAAAAALASEPGISAGTLALVLAASAGPGSGWERRWRDVVGLLRAHPDADVAEAALELRMGEV
ncbi:hypothetical protein ACFQ9X_25850 [Catenulispora yoronensis]